MHSDLPTKLPPVPQSVMSSGLLSSLLQLSLGPCFLKNYEKRLITLKNYELSKTPNNLSPKTLVSVFTVSTVFAVFAVFAKSFSTTSFTRLFPVRLSMARVFLKQS